MNEKIIDFGVFGSNFVRKLIDEKRLSMKNNNILLKPFKNSTFHQSKL